MDQDLELSKEQEYQNFKGSGSGVHYGACGRGVLGVAAGALLKMPKMPELRGKQFPDFVPVDVNTDGIPFKDKTREKQRLKQLAAEKRENRK